MKTGSWLYQPQFFLIRSSQTKAVFAIQLPLPAGRRARAAALRGAGGLLAAGGEPAAAAGAEPGALLLLREPGQARAGRPAARAGRHRLRAHACWYYAGK